MLRIGSRCAAVRSTKTALLLGTIISGAIIGTSPLAAQDNEEGALSAASDDGLNVIIVTARKNAEDLQDVPVAVDVISGDQLDQFEIDEVQDIVSRVPGLSITSDGPGAGASVVLRGVGNVAGSLGSDPAVAFNVDGIPINNGRIIQNAFNDLEQLDVLRGPQAVFFGKSASAGVISLTSRNPTNEFEAGVSGSYEFEEDGYTVEGFVSGPLSDSFRARLVARFNDVNDVITNRIPGVANPERGERTLDGRLTLVFEPSSDFNMNLKLSYLNSENDGSNGNTLQRCANAAAGPGVSIYPPILGLLNPAFAGQPPAYDCDDFGNRTTAVADQFAPEAVQSPNGDHRAGVPFQDTEAFLANLKVEFRPADWLNVTLQGGFFDLSNVGQDNFAGDALGGGFSLEDVSETAFTQELRFSSDLDGPFNFQAGAFLEHRDLVFGASQTAFGATATAALAGLPGFPNGADPITGNTWDWFYESRTEGRTLSFYASGELELIERLRLSGGLRYTDERRDARVLVPYTHALLTGFGLTVPSGTIVDGIDFSDDNFSGEAILTYELADGVNIYGGYKSGFKSGGIDTASLPTVGNLFPQLINPAASVEDVLVFQSETISGFEIGLKSELFDRTMRLNAVAFSYDISDAQIQQFDATLITFDTFNTDTRSRGIEFDAVWQTPIDGLSLNAAVAYLDAEFDGTFVTIAGVDLDGRATRQAPDWSGNIGGFFEADIGESLKFTLAGNMRFSSSYFTNDTSFEDFVQPSFQTYDLAATIGSSDDRWTLSVIGNNLSDEIVTAFAGARPFSLPAAIAPPDTFHRVNRGRQVFVRVGFKY